MPVGRTEIDRMIEQKLRSQFGVLNYGRIAGTPDLTPAWTDLTLEGHWIAFSNPPRYRVHGDMVEFRGEIFLSGGTASAGNPFDMPGVFSDTWVIGATATLGGTVAPITLRVSNTSTGTVSLTPTPADGDSLILDGLEVRVGD